MYNVLYHHSTGNLNADQEIFDKVTVASETLSTSVGAAKKIDDLIIAQTYVPANGIVTVKLFNATGGAIDIAAMDFHFMIVK